jgi:hypothetical protein
LRRTREKEEDSIRATREVGFKQKKLGTKLHLTSDEELEPTGIKS